MFVNKVPFFVTKSRGLQFTTVEALPNRRVSTINSVLDTVLALYKSRGFIVDSLFADYEFEILRPWHPNLNTTAADEHVPDIERHIRTIKDSTRSTYRMLPFRYIPRIMLIHLVKNAVFWINAVPTNDGITRRFSPRYIMTGQHLLASKHAVIPFGAYVQTHEQHTNDMQQRTLSCVCLGPTGNVQGGHWFMSLTSGEKLIRYRWTELPMPQEAIARVNSIGRRQHMPSTMTYANRQGAEIPDTVHTYPSDDDASDSDYSQPDSSNNDSTASADSDFSTSTHDSDASSDASSASSDSDPDDDDDHAFVPHPNPSHQIHIHPPVHPPHHPLIVDVPPPPHPVAAADHPGVPLAAKQGVEDPGVGINDFAADADCASVDLPEENGNEQEQEHEESDNVESTQLPTESEQFRIAENQGRARAAQLHAAKPQRTVHANRYDDFTYTLFDHMHDGIGRNVSDREYVHAHVTAQMSAKKGLQVFGDGGASALVKELHQLVVMNVMSGCKSHELTPEQKRKALRYLMFLKEKRCGRIKGRGCADGRKQRLWKTKEETTSPTVSIESLFISCIIDAMERRDVATIDIPGAFMQANIDEEVHVKFDDELIDLLCQVDPSLSQYVGMERGKRVLYTKLNKALYGTVQASRLFWKKLSTFLIDQNGFERNPYDFCVVNKMINGKQFTVVWYVDDLKLSHVDPSVVDDMIETIKQEFGKKLEVTVRRGQIHDYLGIQFDFSEEGQIVMTMNDYNK